MQPVSPCMPCSLAGPDEIRRAPRDYMPCMTTRSTEEGLLFVSFRAATLTPSTLVVCSSADSMLPTVTCTKDLKLSRLSNLRIRLLLHATSLASHTCSFHPIGGLPRSPVCLLCSLGVCEDILHFLSKCPRLHSIRDPWL